MSQFHKGTEEKHETLRINCVTAEFRRRYLPSPRAETLSLESNYSAYYISLRDKQMWFSSTHWSGGSTLSPIQWVPRGKRPTRELGHSPPSSLEVRNERSCTSTPSMGLHGMDRENFTFMSSPSSSDSSWRVTCATWPKPHRHACRQVMTQIIPTDHKTLYCPCVIK
jgi:hypothetical protein